ncbi:MULTISPECIES: terminase large subunit domain-containing protein [unclassified Mesorhizobium]|uniref:phage terminase large subunit family protein n=1 Tax=unclassified Mesorhizobium TaxID=325217 RepID=UPI001CD11226|nr:MULTISPECIES: terminase family protein [unclassified Mesorhizobium]MBZ9879974.1 terminase large subunit [Mesorhizobium sp. Ca11]
MRGAPGNASASLRWNTPHPSRRCAPIHLLPQGRRERFAMSRHVTFMTIDEAGHYSPEQRATIVAAYPEHEREARAKGIPVLGSGRIFPVAEETIACEPFKLPRWWPRIGALDFGWDHPSAAVELAWDTEADVVYVTKAHRASQQTPAMQALALKGWGDWLPFAWPRDGRRETLEGAGVALAMQYAAHGLNMLTSHARFADGSVSVEAGLMEMLDRMQSGRFKVFSTLHAWFEEFRLFHRKNGQVVKLRDDLMAATRYRKLTLAYVSGAGTLPTSTDGIWLIFTRAGDKGADGTGVGDFTGPASSVTDNIVTFAGTTGKAGKDSGVAVGSLVAGPASAAADNIATFNGTTGKLVKDSGVAVASLAPKANASFTGTFSPPTNAIALNTLADSAAVSVLGRSANSSGTRADIAAGSDDTLLRRVSSALGFGQLTAGMVPAGLVTYAMLASAAIASNSEFQLGTANKLLTAAALKSTVAYQTLTSGASVSWDMSLGNNASLAASTNVTIGNPTNAVPQFGFVLKITAVTSARTVSLSANLVPAAGVESFPITIQTTETVFLAGFVDTASRLVITSVLRT